MNGGTALAVETASTTAAHSPLPDATIRQSEPQSDNAIRFAFARSNLATRYCN